MATGIVSVALAGAGVAAESQPIAVTVLSHVLGWVSAFVFVGLVVVAVTRLFGGSIALDSLRDPDAALRACAFIAACGVLEFRLLGARHLLGAHHVLVRILAALELVGWVILAVVAGRDLVRRRLRTMRMRAHGAWLLGAVATESLAITAADLALDGHRWLLIPAVIWWALGLLMYLAVAALLVARVAAKPALADEATPDSWILMGGLAIATLAAGRIEISARALAADGLAGSAHDAALACWGAATIWLPVLAFAEALRLALRPGSWHFQAAWWATVFPLGMYAVATRTVSSSADIATLQPLARTFAWISFVCWLAVAVGLLHAAWRLRDRVRLPAHPIARGSE